MPDDAAGTIDVADSEYLTLGWWLNKQDADDGTYRFDAFSSGNGFAARETANNTGDRALAGTATYSGAAVGKYAMASTSGDYHEGGHFTASATLTADFDADMDGDAVNGDGTMV